MGKHTSKKPTAGMYFLCMAVGLFLGYVFLQMPLANAKVTREAAIQLTGSFQEYDVDYRKGHIHAISISVSGADKQYVHDVCVSSALVEALAAVPANTEMTLLVHPRSHNVLEIQSNGEILLEFDHSQKLLADNAAGLAILGVGMIVLGVISGIHFVILEIKRYRR